MSDAAPAATEQVLLTWEARVRILTNPEVWSSMLAVLGIPGVLLGALLGFVTRRADVALLVPAGVVAFLLGLFVVVGLVIDFFGGFAETFFLTSAGVRSLSGKAARRLSTATVVVGALAGSAVTAGAGLLAKSEQNVFIPWADVARVKVDARRRYVLVKGGWLDKPIALYCTLENFRQALDIVGAHAPEKLPQAAVGTMPRGA